MVLNTNNWEEDGSGNLTPGDGQAVSVDQLTVNANGSITFNADLTVDSDFQIKTAGGGSDSIAIRDAANSQDIVTFSEGSPQVVETGGRFKSTKSGGPSFMTQVGSGKVAIWEMTDGSTRTRFEANYNTHLFSIKDHGGQGHIFRILDPTHDIEFNPRGTEAFTLTGSTETNDGMTADPETDTEDAFLSVTIGSNSYQIPLYSA